MNPSLISSPRFWVGVASREHVQWGIAGGFCQLCHGKAQALRRMRPGDWMVYYSSRLIMNEAMPCQAFTGLGRIVGEHVYPFQMAPDFTPYRRDVDFLSTRDAPIGPLIDRLDFIPDKRRWGYVFRFGHLEIGRDDFVRIAEAMGISGEQFAASPVDPRVRAPAPKQAAWAF